MKDLEISWHVLDGNEFIQDEDFYLGSYNSSNEIKMSLQVWNNRYGQEETEGIENAKVAISFDSIEDSYLLKYCTVSVDKGIAFIPNIVLDRGVIEIGSLLGIPNDGRDNSKNATNFKQVDLIFKDMPRNLKHGLKNLYFDLERE